MNYTEENYINNIFSKYTIPRNEKNVFTLIMADSNVYIIWKLSVTEEKRERENEFSFSYIKNFLYFSNVGIKLKISFVICQGVMFK